MRYGLYCTLVLVGFAALQWRGVNLLPSPGPTEMPVGLRSTPGGYRSYHSYHGVHGFRGGK
jgi:hypothetical protein